MTDAPVASFNLVDEPWLPVVSLEGGAAEWSLRETLARAHELRELVDPSPLATVALHRLLLAVVHRGFGPASRAAWHALWGAGRLDPARLDDTLDAARPRFDLFDPVHPFYQSTSPSLARASPISHLAVECAAKAWPTLLDHGWDNDGRTMPAAEAARCVVATHAFALGGFVSADNAAGKSSAAAAPLANTAVVLIRGNSLFETLMLNLVVYNLSTGHPFEPFTDLPDRPAWERDEPVSAGVRSPDGYLDWLTFQARAVRLGPPVLVDGAWHVAEAVVMDGYRPPSQIVWHDAETMVPSVARTEKPKPGEDGAGESLPYAPLKFRSGRVLFRDSLALLGSANPETTVRPKTVDTYHRLRDRRPADAGPALPRLLQLDVLGLLGDQKKLVLRRSERFACSPEYLADEALQDRLGAALTLAEEAARDLLGRGWTRAPRGESRPRPLQVVADELLPGIGGKPDPKAVAGFVASLQADVGYWPRLEAPFRTLLADLPAAEPAAMAAWAAAVRAAADATFRDAVRAAGTSPRGYRAAAKAEARFAVALGAMVNAFTREHGPEPAEEAS